MDARVTGAVSGPRGVPVATTRLAVRREPPERTNPVEMSDPRVMRKMDVQKEAVGKIVNRARVVKTERPGPVRMARSVNPNDRAAAAAKRKRQSSLVMRQREAAPMTPQTCRPNLRDADASHAASVDHGRKPEGNRSSLYPDPGRLQSRAPSPPGMTPMVPASQAIRNVAGAGAGAAVAVAAVRRAKQRLIRIRLPRHRA
jgi:hypothetical protein